MANGARERAQWAWIGAGLLAACGGAPVSPPEGQPRPSACVEATAPTPPGPRPGEVRLLVPIGLEKEQAEVVLVPPKGWKADGLSFAPSDQKESLRPIHFSVGSLGISGGGYELRSPRLMREEMASAVASVKHWAATPNYNTGDAARDAVRAKLTLLADEAVGPSGWLLVLRSEFSAEVLASGPYANTFEIRCYAFRPGDGFVISAGGSGSRRPAMT